MGLFDGAFDPQTYGGQGGIPGWLSSLLQNPQPAQSAGFAPPTGNAGNGIDPAGYQYGPGGRQAWMDYPNSVLPPNSQPAGPAPMPQSQPFQQPESGGGNFMAGMLGFLNGGGSLGGSLSNAIQGFTTGQRTDPQGMAQQQQAATYQSLRQSGVPDGIARAATLNPEILKTIAPAYFDTAPKLQETGTDPMTGQKTFAVYRPNAGTLSPVNAGGASQSSAGGSLGAFSEAVKNGVTGEALYEHLPAAMRATVKAMVEGRQPPPSTVAMKSPATLALIDAANAIDPTFDANMWKARSNFNNQLGSVAPNSVGGQKVLMGTALGHLSELAETAAKLGNSNGFGLAPVGSAINSVKNLGTDQAALVNNLNEKAARFSGEVGKLYSGSQGGGVHERESTQARFGGNKTSAELAAALEASRDLITSKLQALENQRNELFSAGGGAKVDFLGEAGKAALAKVDEAIAKLKSNGGQAAAPAPSGVVQWERGPDGKPRQVVK